MFRLLWAAAVLLFLEGIAVARSEATVRYSKAQVFSAALRYLRVDLQYEVTERDAEAAYLLFRHPAEVKGEPPVRGAVELIQRAEKLRVQVSMPKLPAYQEDVFKRGLLAKLRAEYGRPSVVKKPPKSPPNNGSDSGK